MKKYKIALAVVVLLFVEVTAYSQGKKEEYGTTISTNLAYLTLSGISCSGSSMLIIAPIYFEIMMNDYLSANPTAIFIISRNATTSHIGMVTLAEFGIAFHPNAKGHEGLIAGITPGLAYSFDSKKIGFTLSGDFGYQWIVGKKWVIGAVAGGRLIYIDGQMVIPDLGINVGYIIR